MAKITPIKWRQEDYKKLATYVRKFNAKITRLEKMYPDEASAGVFPERMKTEELKKQITTRNDFNRQLRSIDRFFRKGADTLERSPMGNMATKWEIRETKINMQIINQAHKRHAQEIIEKTNAPGISQRLAEEPQFQQVYFPTDRPESWSKIVKTFRTRANQSYESELNRRYLENYLTGIQTMYGNDVADTVRDMVEKYGITGEILFIAANAHEELSINFIYMPHFDKEGLPEGAENLLEAWNEFVTHLDDPDYFKIPPEPEPVQYGLNDYEKRKLGRLMNKRKKKGLDEEENKEFWELVKRVNKGPYKQ